MSYVCSSSNNMLSVLAEVYGCPPWRKVGVGIGCFYLVCYKPLPQKLGDVVEYYQATLFMVYSVTNYLKLETTTSLF